MEQLSLWLQEDLVLRVSEEKFTVRGALAHDCVILPGDLGIDQVPKVVLIVGNQQVILLGFLSQ